MLLLNYLVKSETRKKLLELFLRDGLEGSINDLAQIAGASYALVHEELRAMQAAGLVHARQLGRAKVYTLNKESEDLLLLRRLFNLEDSSQPKAEIPDFETVKANLVFYGAPLHSNKTRKQRLNLEETLALGVYYSKKESTLLRTFPVALYKNRNDLDNNKLWHYSHKYNVKRHMGFLLELTGKLSSSKKFNHFAKKYSDNRNKKSVSYFDKKTKSPTQEKLEQLNTPKLAKKWLFTMNLGMDSFESFFNKFRAV